MYMHNKALIPRYLRCTVKAEVYSHSQKTQLLFSLKSSAKTGIMNPYDRCNSTLDITTLDIDHHIELANLIIKFNIFFSFKEN